MKRLLLCLIPALALSAPALAADHGHSHGAHQHGSAKLEVVIDGTALHIRLESPLDSVLGFEHAPGNAKEKAAVARMKELLGQGDKLFGPTTAAQCRFAGATVEAPVLEGQSVAAKGDGHGDLDADFRFICAQPGKLTGMEVRLPEHFPRMRGIDAQVAGPRGQSAKRLSGKMRFLNW
ncbi:MAG: DUF2796 domain-containing protein [Pseudomonadota bacterium]